MQLLTLSSDQENCSKRENGYSWTLHNFDLGCNNSVALSSCYVDFAGNRKYASSIALGLNLIDKNFYNELGIIGIIPGNSANGKNPNSHEFWPLDTRRPKNIELTFHHANVNKVKNFNVTLVFNRIENAPQSLVRQRVYK